MECEVFDVLGYRFHRDGKGFQGAERTICKGLRSWWRDKYICRSKTVPMTAKCKRVHSHVCSTVLNGSINWPLRGAMINKVRAWEAQILRLTFRPRMRLDETWVGCKIRTSFLRNSWRKMGLPFLALRSVLGWRTTAWWRRSGAGPPTAFRGETQSWVPQQRSTVGHPWRDDRVRGKLDDHGTDTTSQGIRSLLESMKQAVVTKNGTQRDPAD